VTAGVESNALRTSADEGLFYEPGTINVVLLTNMKLTPRAMSRAIVTVTEAKTAAMQDLDIRSAYNPRLLQATGTGTDEVLVVEGRGKLIDNTGGHCKMGELIARAVYDGVRDAVDRQNGIAAHRNVLRRLRERNIDLHGLLRQCGGFSDIGGLGKCLGRMEDLLLKPRYASLLESAFALSDAYERGQIEDLGAFKVWCLDVAREIAGDGNIQWLDRVTSEDVPVAVRMALDAFFNGLLPVEERNGDHFSKMLPADR
jgi:iron complex transport system substrate-binding protein